MSKWRPPIGSCGNLPRRTARVRPRVPPEVGNILLRQRHAFGNKNDESMRPAVPAAQRVQQQVVGPLGIQLGSDMVIGDPRECHATVTGGAELKTTCYSQNSTESPGMF